MLPVRKFEERLTTSTLLKAHIGSRVPDTHYMMQAYEYAWPVKNKPHLKVRKMARTGGMRKRVMFMCSRWDMPRPANAPVPTCSQ